jgi:cytochrome c biogenesis protein CcmG/thiol:disulfide interchange protein DsbE
MDDTRSPSASALSPINLPASHGPWLAAVVAFLIAGGLWISASRVATTTDPTTAAPQVGFLAPDFTAPTLRGETVTLSELRGKPVVVNFWATWCPPCRAELPHFQASHDARSADFTLLAVDEREAPEDVARFASRLGLTFSIPLDTDGRIGAEYRVRAYPTTFFIDADGVIRRIVRGTTTRAVLESTLASLGGDDS